MLVAQSLKNTLTRCGSTSLGSTRALRVPRLAAVRTHKAVTGVRAEAAKERVLITGMYICPGTAARPLRVYTFDHALWTYRCKLRYWLGDSGGVGAKRA